MTNHQSRRFIVSACLTVSLGTALNAASEDWPQHLGPTQDAVSAETGLLDDWPDAGPPELWRHDVGVGFAGTAIVDGKVFLHDREHGVADILRVIDLDTGKALWQFKHESPGRVNYPGTRSTPCVTDTHVYLSGNLGDIHAINRKTKKADWSMNMWEAYPDDIQVFGYGPSPMIVDDLLLLTPTAPEDPVVIAVDPKTGKEVWQSEAKLTADQNQTHHTPVVRTIAGVRGISCRDRTHVYHIEIKTGKTIWSHKVYEFKDGPHVTIPPVTVIGRKQQYVFVTNGYENGSVLLEVKAVGGAVTFVERYRIPEGGQVHPAIYHDKHLYLNINENVNLRGRNKQGGLACIDPNNGELKWHTKNEPNLNRGATTLADGKLYAFDGDTGELLLINPSPEKFELIAKFESLKPQGNKNNAWSPIVISEGRLIIRDHRQIVCYDLRKKK